MKFGVFDHMDRGRSDLGRQFGERLRLIELYEQAGFHAYHLAEHHATPLGMAPSPSVFLAAVAQRTRTLRFGPLVYTVNLYHPLRLIDEICMLDQLSGGRLELGVGRGISPYEVGYYGVDPATGPERFAEALDVILKGLTEEAAQPSRQIFHFRRRADGDAAGAASPSAAGGTAPIRWRAPIGWPSRAATPWSG